MDEQASIDQSSAERSTHESQRRILLFRRAFEIFLRSAPRDIPKGEIHPYLIFEQVGYDGHYVQFKLFSDDPEGDELYGEVGSCEWFEPTTPNQPLAPTAQAFLAAHGFTGGGRAANYGRRHLPMDPAWLACLTEALFSVYEAALDFDVRVNSDVPDVEWAFVPYPYWRVGAITDGAAPTGRSPAAAPAGRAAGRRTPRRRR